MIKSLFFSLIIFLFVLNSYQNPNSYPSPSLAHTELTNYGFPIGLLPSEVINHAINQTSGEFFVDLGGDCQVTLPPDNYLAIYSNKITGKIEHGRIAKLDGIKVRAFFKWWSITGIRSSGENLVFEVGMVTAKYPSRNFDESPACEGRHSAS